MSNIEKNKYSRLLSNTALFGISTFSSKVLSFLLTRLYTSYLEEASYGIVDLVTVTANLLIPLVSLGISNAVIRFGLEKGVSKSGVYSSGLLAIGSGFAILLALFPLLNQISLIQENIILMYVYVLISCLRTLNCQFVRAKLQTRLYALDGILTTGYTIGFNILFLVVLNMGTTGYLLSIICADACSTFFLFFVAKIWPNIRFKKFDFSLYKSMLRYCLPLVPALMFWWVNNASDRYFISYMLSPSENGLYAVAYKIPYIVTLFSTIFTEAWQLSAITDGQDAGRERFFTQVFSALSGVTFLVGGLLILLCQPIIALLAAPSYFSAWQYVPFLIIATVFSSLVSFQNSIYMVEKKSTRSLFTMTVGAAVNLALNALLIPIYGVNGAGFATFISFLVVYIIRTIDTRRYIRMNYQPLRMVLNTLLMLGLSVLMLLSVSLWPLWCALLVALIFLINFRSIYRAVMQVLHKKPRAQKEDSPQDVVAEGGKKFIYHKGDTQFMQ